MQQQNRNDQQLNSRSNYYCGIFYYNRDDERVVVPKRRGWGSTVNFAHPTSWLLLAIPLIGPAMVLTVIFLTAR